MPKEKVPDEISTACGFLTSYSVIFFFFVFKPCMHGAPRTKGAIHRG